jgi:3'-phosphoadenosine 5'-phosphosulfate sulfotransferase (PAPS reductase)/FAD synthetase
VLTSTDEWRGRWLALGLPAEAIPDHPELGMRYPWGEIWLRAMSSVHRRKVAVAQERVRQAAARADRVWRLSWSAGKDSTACAGLIADCGLQATFPAFGEKDDIDYPAEPEYMQRVAVALGMGEPEVLRPKVTLLDWLQSKGVNLTEDLHSQAAGLSSEHFYGLLREHRKRTGYDAAILGLRANESKHRTKNRAVHGWMYERGDGLVVAAPLADWEDIDVHAYLASRDIPVLPVYLCVDPGMDALRIRKSWWLSGGYSASVFGHYQWLRRWWPGLWERATAIDGRVRLLS